MFTLAILIGVYSYVIMALGLSGLLYKPYIVILTVIYIFVTFYFNKQKLIQTSAQYSQLFKKSLKLRNTFVFLLIVILFLQTFINLIGALGPELGFDALWYHLMLPKIYLQNHAVVHIPGGLLYYSDMPKLTEMLYTAVLAVSNEIGVKLTHFSFGILTLIAIYKLSSKFFSQKVALLTVLIFYSNLVVGWQSVTAYVDLARTFFEVMALWGFMNWLDKQEIKWFIASAAILGLAISVKLLSVVSLVVFCVLIIFTVPQVSIRIHPKGGQSIVRRFGDDKNLLIYLFAYLLIALFIALPWFVFSYVHTGNPIYPFFTSIYKVDFDANLFSPLKFASDVWTLFTGLADPISIVYIIFLPLILIFFKRLPLYIKLVAFYSFLSIIVWYITPRTGGGRFILPYLPAFSIVVGGVLQELGKIKGFVTIRNLSIAIIFFISLISILYRGVANLKYIPVIVGKQTKEDFLMKNLNFSFGDFYDVDGYFKNHIKQNGMVLLYGFHNLYYVDFPFVDSSWVKEGDSFNYIAVQNSSIPQRFRSWDLIYSSPKTHVNLYSDKGRKWTY